MAYPLALACPASAVGGWHFAIALSTQGITLSDGIDHAGAHRRGPNWLPAGRWAQDRLNGHSVHNPVDDLCRTAPSLCASPEKLGILAVSYGQAKSSTWINTIHTLCTERKQELSTCHAEKSLE